MVDYSKWDRMQWSDDDDDDDEDARITRPRVTRLEAPSSVSFNPSSGDIVIQENTTTKPQSTNNKDPSFHATKKAAAKEAGKAAASTAAAAVAAAAASTTKPTAPTAKPTASTKKPTASTTTAKRHGDSSHSIPESWTEKGSVCEITTSHHHHGITSQNKTQLYWTQDRSTVTFRFALISSCLESSSTSDNNNQVVRGWTCHVRGILSYDNRNSAVGTSGDKPRLILTRKCDDTKDKNKTFFEGELPYPVHLPQDDDQVDWSIERIESVNNNSSSSVPFLCVTLFKATPMAGMILWWNRPFTSCTELTQMPWRGNNNNIKDGSKSGGNSSSTSSNNEFQQAWDEAHRLFKEKRLQEKKS